MPVTITHQDFDLHEPQWRRIDDALAGRDAVLRATVDYLPMLAGQIDDPRAYEAYQKRAVWFGATARTLEALVGAIFRKDPTWTVSAQLEKRMENFDGRGNTVYTFAQKVVKHVMSKGRYGVLIDMPQKPNPGDPTTYLPFFAGYAAQNIRSWRMREFNGVPKLDQVILRSGCSGRRMTASASRWRFVTACLNWTRRASTGFAYSRHPAPAMATTPRNPPSSRSPTAT